TETYDVIGQRAPGAELTLIVNRRNGERLEVPVTCRLDSDEEVTVYEAGGYCSGLRRTFWKGRCKRSGPERPQTVTHLPCTAVGVHLSTLRACFSAVDPPKAQHQRIVLGMEVDQKDVARQLHRNMSDAATLLTRPPAHSGAHADQTQHHQT